MMVTWNRDLREESTGVFLATDGRRIPNEQLLKTVFVSSNCICQFKLSNY